MNRKYELVYVVSPDSTEEQVTELHTQIEGIVTRMGGTIEKTENWGRRRLAYQIDRYREGSYHIVLFEAPADAIAELEQMVGIPLRSAA